MSDTVTGWKATVVDKSPFLPSLRSLTERCGKLGLRSQRPHTQTLLLQAPAQSSEPEKHLGHARRRFIKFRGDRSRRKDLVEIYPGTKVLAAAIFLLPCPLADSCGQAPSLSLRTNLANTVQGALAFPEDSTSLPWLASPKALAPPHPTGSLQAESCSRRPAPQTYRSTGVTLRLLASRGGVKATHQQTHRNAARSKREGTCRPQRESA